MLLRRLGLIAPLAVLVAVLVHLALFGTQHAPGAEHAGRLFSSLGAALSLAALGSVLFAALGLQRRRRREHRIAGAHRLFFPLELAAGGTLAFALIELAEGHSPLACGAWQFAATAAAAYAVALFARYVTRLLARSGDALAAFANTSHAPAPVAFAFVRTLRSARAYRASRPNACQGRAPPLFS
jgi:hypothetical protein